MSWDGEPSAQGVDEFMRAAREQTACVASLEDGPRGPRGAAFDEELEALAREDECWGEYLALEERGRRAVSRRLRRKGGATLREGLAAFRSALERLGATIDPAYGTDGEPDFDSVYIDTIGALDDVLGVVWTLGSLIELHEALMDLAAEDEAPASQRDRTEDEGTDDPDPPGRCVARSPIRANAPNAYRVALVTSSAAVGIAA